jgi:beta-glucosidase
MTDGPNGARGESYVSGIKAACFPCSTALGATFNVDVLFDAGRHIAEECISKSASVLLAPTVNVIRSPLGVWHCLPNLLVKLTDSPPFYTAGRNFETYSEDPVVLGTLAAAFINGIGPSLSGYVSVEGR